MGIGFRKETLVEMGLASPPTLQSMLQVQGFGMATIPVRNQSASSAERFGSALDPLRDDHPTLRPTKRGKKEDAVAVTQTPQSRAKALADIENDVFARSSKATNNSQWGTWAFFSAPIRLLALPFQAGRSRVRSKKV